MPKAITLTLFTSLIACNAIALDDDAAPSPPLASGPWGARQPKANDQATYVDGTLRITMLTDRLVRVETGDAFEDRATQVIINRYAEHTPTYEINHTPAATTITTSSLNITYESGDPLGTLTISGEKFATWRQERRGPSPRRASRGRARLVTGRRRLRRAPGVYKFARHDPHAGPAGRDPA